MNHFSSHKETVWNRQPFTQAEFFGIVGIPVSFVIVACTLLFIMVIRAGG